VGLLMCQGIMCCNRLALIAKILHRMPFALMRLQMPNLSLEEVRKVIGHGPEEASLRAQP